MTQKKTWIFLMILVSNVTPQFAHCIDKDPTLSDSTDTDSGGSGSDRESQRPSHQKTPNLHPTIHPKKEDPLLEEFNKNLKKTRTNIENYEKDAEKKYADFQKKIAKLSEENTHFLKNRQTFWKKDSNAKPARTYEEILAELRQKREKDSKKTA